VLEGQVHDGASQEADEELRVVRYQFRDIAGVVQRVLALIEPLDIR